MWREREGWGTFLGRLCLCKAVETVLCTLLPHRRCIWMANDTKPRVNCSTSTHKYTTDVNYNDFDSTEMGGFFFFLTDYCSILSETVTCRQLRPRKASDSSLSKHANLQQISRCVGLLTSSRVRGCRKVCGFGGFFLCWKIIIDKTRCWIHLWRASTLIIIITII